MQAGTGTGKSLAYLVPALLHARRRRSVVVAPRPSRCRHQLVDHDLPRLVDAVSRCSAGGRRSRPQGPLQLPVPATGHSWPGCRTTDEDALRWTRRPRRPLGRRRAAAAGVGRGDRHRRPGRAGPGRRRPGVAAGLVPARECVGASRCPFGAECFAELARARAARGRHRGDQPRLLAIDALEAFAVLPEHDVVVVDEAHELVDRVTGVATAELTPTSRRAGGRRGPGGSVDGTRR